VTLPTRFGCFLVLVVPTGAFAQVPTLTASEAKSHVGSTATVCGKVITPKYATSTKGQPTFLNFDKAYPNQEFTVVIWGSDRAKFGTPEVTYNGKTICATGKIQEYRDGVEIVASDPKQISLRQSSVDSQPARATTTAPGVSQPQGATAQCRDGTFSFSKTRSGTCSHHGGVARWLGRALHVSSGFSRDQRRTVA